MVTERSRERLREDGFTDDEIERVFEAVPVATHNQRGIGTLYVGCPEGCDASAIEAETLLAIVEDSMSSEIYELMKRPDEVEVVEKAHRAAALRRGLRARDGPHGRPSASPTSATTPSCSPARRTSRRSTSTTSWPSATALIGELAARARDRRARARAT